MSGCGVCGRPLPRGRRRFCSTRCRDNDRDRRRIVRAIDRLVRELHRLDPDYGRQPFAGWKLYWHTRARASDTLDHFDVVYPARRRRRRIAA